MRLADLAQGRDNNFQLLRFVAASAVIVFHCYALTGRWGDEPLWRLIPEFNLGALGVKIFFVISGFLVTKSWLERSRLASFAAARALRIYPALACAVLVSIALAAWSSAVPLAAFLVHPQTVTYAWSNALAWNPEFFLPGAFATNPYPDATNGSLWTLPIEMRLYVIVAIAGVVGLLTRRRIFTVVIILAVALLFAKPAWMGMLGSQKGVREVTLLFALGSLAYVWRERIPVSLAVALACLVLIGWNPAGLARDMLFEPLLAYLVLVAAYHPRLQWRTFNRLGDYSYGLYIYAFPIQQTVIRLANASEPISPPVLLAVAFPLTLAVAVLSWHVVEKPALGLKSRFARVGARNLAT